MQPGHNTTVNFVTHLTYFDPMTERKAGIMLNNKSEYTTNEQTYANNFSEWVGTQVAIYESNETLERAMKEVDKATMMKPKNGKAK
ncbi:hypothetical protein EMGBS15_16250 [Filimonas sp.]|nr:hypothetical protein EMGBS15_16250 [Filimonas sp.]